LWVLQHTFEDEDGHGVVVQSVGFAAQPQGLQGDRASARKTVQDLGRVTRETLADERTRLLKQGFAAGIVAVHHFPRSKLSDQLQECSPFLFGFGVGKEGRQGGGAGGGQGPPGPPDVQGGDVALPDVLLPPRFLRDLADGKGHLDEPPLHLPSA